jgi:hypothetical protein
MSLRAAPFPWSRSSAIEASGRPRRLGGAAFGGKPDPAADEPSPDLVEGGLHLSDPQSQPIAATEDGCTISAWSAGIAREGTVGRGSRRPRRPRRRPWGAAAPVTTRTGRPTAGHHRPHPARPSRELAGRSPSTRPKGCARVAEKGSLDVTPGTSREEFPYLLQGRPCGQRHDADQRAASPLTHPETAA